jgi:transcription termination factor Rho
MTVELHEVTPPYTLAELKTLHPGALIVTDDVELERALESGRPTIIIDSLTALARAANRIHSDDEPKNQIISGIVEQRLTPLKQLVARAHASSQKVIALVYVNTGSRMNDVIVEYFREALS